MYKKPITQKAKSPLKQTKSAGDLVMSDTKIIKGGEETTVVDGSIDPGKATGGKQTSDANAYVESLKKRFPNSTGQQLVDGGYISSAYADRFPSSFSKTTTVKTPDKEVETKKNLYTRDKTDAINPYGDYQNRLVERRAEGSLKSNARKGLNALARDYAYETADGDSKGLDKFLSNRKQMRDYKRGIAEGMSADQISQARELRRTKRGATALQTDLTEAQDALKRARNQRSQGASRDDVVLADDRVAKATDLGAMDVQLQKGEMKGKLDIDSPAEMRYQSNVGIKKHSPMKKGYFKNK
jgi:hypothetical protein